MAMKRWVKCLQFEHIQIPTTNSDRKLPIATVPWPAKSSTSICTICGTLEVSTGNTCLAEVIPELFY
jgi:hypothetical protein